MKSLTAQTAADVQLQWLAQNTCAGHRQRLPENSLPLLRFQVNGNPARQNTPGQPDLEHQARPATPETLLLLPCVSSHYSPARYLTLNLQKPELTTGPESELHPFKVASASPTPHNALCLSSKDILSQDLLKSAANPDL